MQTGRRGFGLRTTAKYQKGDFIIEYRGEVISREEIDRRLYNEYLGRKGSTSRLVVYNMLSDWLFVYQDFYMMDLDEGEVLDAGMKGSDARFINVSFMFAFILIVI